MGLDVDRRKAAALVDLGKGFVRSDNAYAQTLTLSDGQTLVVIAKGARGGIVYRVDRQQRSLVKVAEISDAFHMSPLSRTLVGLGSPDGDPGRFSTTLYDAHTFASRPGTTLTIAPAFSDIDTSRGQICYADSASADQRLVVYRPLTSSSTVRRLSLPGNLTGIACSQGRFALAIGDLPDGGSTPQGSVEVRSMGGRPSTVVVSPPQGTSGKVMLDGTKILTDTAVGTGRALAELDWTSKLLRQVTLPQLGDVQSLVRVKANYVLVSRDRLYVVSARDFTASMVSLPGDNITADIQPRIVS